MDLMEDKKDKDLTYLTFIDKKWSWCTNSVQKLFSQRRTLAANSALFVAYKAQKLLIILKNTFISIIFE